MKKKETHKFNTSEKTNVGLEESMYKSIKQHYHLSFKHTKLYSFMQRRKDFSGRFCFLLGLPIIAACSKVEDISDVITVQQNSDAFSGRDVTEAIEVTYSTQVVGGEYGPVMLYVMGNPYSSADGIDDGFKPDPDGDNIKIMINAMPTAGNVYMSPVSSNSYTGNYDPITGIDTIATASGQILQPGSIFVISSSQLTFLNSLYFVPNENHVTGTKEFRFVASEYNSADTGMSTTRNTTNFTIRFIPENDQPVINQPQGVSRTLTIDQEEGIAGQDMLLASYTISDADGDSDFAFNLYYMLGDTVAESATDKFYAMYRANQGVVEVYRRSGVNIDYEANDGNFNVDGLSKNYKLLLVALDSTSSAYTDVASYSDTSKQEIIVNIVDVNEKPTELTFNYNHVVTKTNGDSSNTYEIQESTNVVQLGKFSTTDGDHYDNLVGENNFYYIISSVNGEGYDSSDHPFTVDSSTGSLTYTGSSGGSDTTYNIIVQSFDNQSKQANNNLPYYSGSSQFVSKTFSITIKNVNSEHSFANDQQTIHVTEGSIVVSYEAATDADNDFISYTISGGLDQNRFLINADGGLRFSTAPDYENPLDTLDSGSNSYFVEITASVQGQEDQQTLLQVIVDDINEAPTKVELVSPSAITEVGKLDGANEYGGKVGTLETTDPDGYDAATVYRIVPNYEQGGLFTVMYGNELHLTNPLSAIYLDAINYEDLDATKEIALKVIATDGGGNEREEILKIQVRDVNEKPQALDYSISMQTATQREITVETLRGLFSDPDSVSAYNTIKSIRFLNATEFNNVIGGTAKIKFLNSEGGVGEVNIVSGQAYDINNLQSVVIDNPQNQSFSTLEYEIIDTGNEVSNKASIQLTTLLTPNTLPVISTSDNEIAVSEEQITVFNYAATDADGDSLTYFLPDVVDNVYFSYSDTGLLSFISAPNYENAQDGDRNNFYDIVLGVSDGKDEIFKQLTLQVFDINEKPSLINALIQKTVSYAQEVTISIDEFINNFQDPDSYASPNGRMHSIIFDSLPQSGTLFYRDDQGAKHQVVQSSAYAPENVNHFFIENITSTSPTTITYRIMDGSPSPLSTEQGVLQLTLNNTAPQFIYLDADGATSIDYRENTASQTDLFVGDITASDDQANTLTYRIVPRADNSQSWDANLFTISNNTKLYFSNSVNFEDANSAFSSNEYVVIVEASDGISVTTNVITVNIKDINEQPNATSNSVALSLTYSSTGSVFSLDQLTHVFDDPDVGPEVPDTSVNANLGAIKFTSLSNNATLQYRNSSGELFDVQTGVLYYKNEIDSFIIQSTQSNGTFQYLYNLLDGGGLQTSPITATISLGNNLPVFGDGITSFNINENEKTVTRFQATDADNHTITYHISDAVDRDDVKYFTINSQTGQLAFKENVDTDYENPVDGKTEFTFIVNASDGIATTSKAITVSIVDINEAPQIDLRQTLALGYSDGGTEIGKDFITNTFIDEDLDFKGQSDKVIFKSLPSSLSLAIKMSGQFSSSPLLVNTEYVIADIESIVASNTTAGSNYDLAFLVLDKGGMSSNEQELTLQVGNKSNTAPSFNTNMQTNYTIAEGRSVSITLQASDPDNDTLTYSITGLDSQYFTKIGDNVFTFEAKDYESPVDFNGDNVYSIQAFVRDSHNDQSSTTISVTVTNTNDTPSVNPTVQESRKTFVVNYKEQESANIIDWTTLRNGNFFTDDDTLYNAAIGVSNEFYQFSVMNIRMGTELDENKHGYNIGQLTYHLSAGVEGTAVSAGDVFTYSQAGYFSYLTQAGSHNGEYTFYIDYKVSDHYKQSDDIGTIKVNVLPNKAPVFTNEAETVQLSLSENNISNMHIYTFLAKDPDYATGSTSSNITYQVSNSNFRISNDGLLYSLQSFNFETLYSTINQEAKLEFQVTATSEGQSTSKNVRVNIVDVNEAPTKVKDPEKVFVDVGIIKEIDKELFVNAFEDPDIFNSQFQIKYIEFLNLPSTASFFAIVEGLATAIQINTLYEIDTITNFTYLDGSQTRGSTQAVTYRVKDSLNYSSDSAIMNFQANILANTAPVFTNTADEFSVNENITGNVVVTLTATDNQNNALNYSIVSGLDSNYFSITQNDRLTFNHAGNFESPQDVDRDNVYWVQVKVEDLDSSGNTQGTYDTKTFSVRVIDVNETPYFSPTTRTLNNKIASETNISKNDFTINFVDPDLQTTDFGNVGSIKFTQLGIAADHFYYVNTGSSAETKVKVGQRIILDNVEKFIYRPAVNKEAESLTIIYSLYDKGNIPTSNSSELLLTFYNNAPQFISSGSVTVDEYVSGTQVTKIQQLQVTDTDSDAISYSIKQNVEHAANFSIVQDFTTGSYYLESNTKFDHEIQNVYYVTVVASDGVASTEQRIIVNIADVNEAPSFTDRSPVRINKDNTDRTEFYVSIFTNRFTDVDNANEPFGQAQQIEFTNFVGNGVFQYQTVSNPVWAHLQSGIKYNISDIVKLSYNGAKSGSFNVHIYDGGGMKTDGFLPFEIVESAPVNNAPAFTNNLPTTYTVIENVTSVGTFAATDVDGDAIIYSIDDVAQGRFFTYDANGLLSFKTAPNYEDPQGNLQGNTYTVRLRASDSNGESVTHTLSVSVMDVNETPIANTPDAKTFNFIKSLNSNLLFTGSDLKSNFYFSDPDTQSIAGVSDVLHKIQIVGLSIDTGASNPNAYSDSQLGSILSVRNGLSTSYNTYPTIIDVYDDMLFYYNEGNEVKQNYGGYTFDIKFKVFDGFVWSDNISSLKVNILPDNKPVFGDINNFSINENLPINTQLSNKLTAYDPDNSNSVITFALVNDSSASPFTVSSSGVISSNRSFDYETTQSVTIRVEATSEGISKTIQNINITILDQNEAPYFVSNPTKVNAVGPLTSGEVEHLDITLNQLVAGSFNDPDTNAGFTIDSVRFTLPTYGTLQLVDINNNVFNIQADNYYKITDYSKVRFVSPVIAAATQTTSFTFSVKDKGGLIAGNFAKQDIEIVKKIPDNTAPEFINSNYVFYANENDTSYTMSVLATDAQSDPITYTLLPYAGQELDVNQFRIANGTISLVSALDYENPKDADANNTYYFYVQATDSQGFSSQTTVVVNVSNRNDLPLAGDGNASTIINTYVTASMSQTATEIVNSATLKSGLYFSDTDTVSDPARSIGNTFYSMRLKSITFNNKNGDEIGYTLGQLNISFAGASENVYTQGTMILDINTIQSISYKHTHATHNTAYDVVVEFDVSDGFEFSTNTDSFTFSVSANQAPVFTNTSVVNLNLNEAYAYNSQLLFDANAYDPDMGQTTDSNVTYSLSANPSGKFFIDSTNGYFRVSGTFDYEADPTQYVIDIIATDNLGAQSSKTITVNIVDVNEAPLKIGGDPAALNLGLSYVNLAGSLTAIKDEETISIDTLKNVFTDPDSGTNGQISKIIFTSIPTDLVLGYYQTSGSSSQQKIRITAGSQYDISTVSNLYLYAPTAILQPSNPGTKQFGSVQYVVLDALGLYSPTAELKINFVDTAPVFYDTTNDLVPTYQTLSLNENEMNVSLLYHAYDVDGDAVTYSLGSSTDAASFIIVSNTGQIIANQAFDYETAAKKSFTFNVFASANNKSTVSQVTINIQNVNERPVYVDPNNIQTVITVEEGKIENFGVNLLTSKFIDPDDVGQSVSSIQSIIFTSVPQDYGTLRYKSGSIDINIVANQEYNLANIGSLLYFKANDDVSAESEMIYKYKVKDSSLDSSEAELKLIVQPSIPDTSLEFVTTHLYKELYENNTFVYTPLVQNVTGDLVLSVSSGSGNDNQDGGKFQFINGSLYFIIAPDFENKDDANMDGIYNVVIEARDGTNNVASMNITVTVINQDESQELGLILDSSHINSMVKENVAGVVIGTLSYRKDGVIVSQGITYELAEAYRDKYVIDGDKLKLAPLYFFDYEKASTEEVIIIVKKDQVEVYDDSKIIAVADDVSDNGELIAVSSQIISIEQVSGQEEIGQLVLLYQDGAQAGQAIENVVFTIIESDTGFTIGTGEDAGKVYISQYDSLNFINRRVELLLRATYDGNVHEGTVVFHAHDILATELKIDNNTIIENVQDGQNDGSRTIGELFISENNLLNGETTSRITGVPIFEILYDPADWHNSSSNIYHADLISNFIVNATTLSVVDNYDLDYERETYVNIPIKVIINTSSGDGYSFVSNIQIDIIDDLSDNSVTITPVSLVREIVPGNIQSSSSVKLFTVDVFANSELIVNTMQIGNVVLASDAFEVRKVQNEADKYEVWVSELNYEAYFHYRHSTEIGATEKAMASFSYNMVFSDGRSFHKTGLAEFQIENIDDPVYRHNYFDMSEFDPSIGRVHEDTHSANLTINEDIFYIYNSDISSAQNILSLRYLDPDNTTNHFSVSRVMYKGVDYGGRFYVSANQVIPNPTDSSLLMSTIYIAYDPNRAGLDLPSPTHMALSPSDTIIFTVKASSSDGDNDGIYDVNQEFNYEMRVSGIKKLQNLYVNAYTGNSITLSSLELAEGYESSFNAKMYVENADSRLIFQGDRILLSGSFVDNIGNPSLNFTLKIYDDQNNNNIHDNGESFFYESHQFKLVMPNINMFISKVIIDGIDENTVLADDNLVLAEIAVYSDVDGIPLDISVPAYYGLNKQKLDDAAALKFMTDNNLASSYSNYEVFRLSFAQGTQFDYESTSSGQHYYTFHSTYGSKTSFVTIDIKDVDEVPSPAQAYYDIKAFVYVRNNVQDSGNFGFAPTYYFNDPDEGYNLPYYRYNRVLLKYVDGSTQDVGNFISNSQFYSYSFGVKDDYAKQKQYGTTETITYTVQSTYNDSSDATDFDMSFNVYYGMIDTSQLTLSYSSRSDLNKGDEVGTLSALHQASGVTFSLKDDYGVFIINNNKLIFNADETKLLSYVAVVDIDGYITVNNENLSFSVTEYITVNINENTDTYELKLEDSAKQAVTSFTMPVGGLSAGTEIGTVALYENGVQITPFSFAIKDNNLLFQIDSNGTVSTLSPINSASMLSFLVVVTNDQGYEITQNSFSISFSYASSSMEEDTAPENTHPVMENTIDTIVQSSFFAQDDDVDYGGSSTESDANIGISMWYDVA